jgi:glycosyltransferase involved in cell wall biosynthesis
VIDGGSTDSSIEIIRKYESFLDGWTGERDGGQSDAINRGLSRSKGMLANWLCSDDFLLPGALWELAGTFMKEPESILYVGAGCNVDEQGRVLYERWNTESQVNEPLDWIQNWFFQPSAFFRHEFWQEHPLDVELHFAMDLDFYIRASHHGSICLVPQLISCAREHPQSKSIVRRAEFFGEIARVQARYGGADIIGRDVTRLQKAVREILGSWPCRFLREFLPSVDWHGLK